jgi:hypothetical protein
MYVAVAGLRAVTQPHVALSAEPANTDWADTARIINATVEVAKTDFLARSFTATSRRS